jgi:RNA polymerase sigma-70 factor (ECF subfamily)
MGRERPLEVIHDSDTAYHFAPTAGRAPRGRINGELSFPLRPRREGGPVFGLPLSILERRSEDEALRQFIADHEAAIRRLAHTMLRDRRDVEEALMDTFAKAHAARRLYRGEASERTWLHRICFNICVDRLRSRRRDPAPLDPELDLPAGATDPELRLTLWQEIEDLPARLQAPFRLRHAGYSITEIAKLAGVPRTTVNGHYNAACERLRERLAGQLDEFSRFTKGADDAAR